MNATNLPADDSHESRKRFAVFAGIGAGFIVLGNIFLFLDGLDTVAWTMIAGGAVWVFISLGFGYRAKQAPAQRRKGDDAGPVIVADSGSGPSSGGRRGHDEQGDSGWGGFDGGDGGGGGGGD